ncbi:MAG: glycosyltransferase family 39 protein [Candidatus Margulisbacteria bacterium]|nr:glycosyltransferase family 39 protein [Candidatus Margulisiibacteriota bacterium]
MNYKQTIIDHLKKNTLLYILLSGIIVWNLFWITKIWQLAILYPYRLHYGEDVLLEQARLFSEGSFPYTPLSQYPLTVGLYMPFFSLLSAIGIKIWGVSFMAGRIVTVISTIGISTCMFFLLKIINNSRVSWAGWIAGGLFLLSPIVMMWSQIARVDMLGLLWTALGLLWFIRTYPKGKWMVSIIFFLLAFYTKQSYLSAPAAITCYLAFVNRRHMIYFFLAFSGGLLGIFGLLNVLTDGQFYFHMITANQNTMDFHYYLSLLKKLFLQHKSIMILCPLTVALCIKKKAYRLWIIYLSISFLAATSIAKHGSNLNYFLELIFAMCLMMGLLFHRLHDLKKPLIKIISLSVVSLMLFFPIFKTRALYPTYSHNRKIQLNNIQKINQYTSKIINQVKGPIVSEDMALLVLNHKPILYQPFIISQLTREKKFDERPLLSDINRRVFQAVILNFDILKKDHTTHFSEGMVTAFRKHYRLYQRVGYNYIYLLNPRLRLEGE